VFDDFLVAPLPYAANRAATDRWAVYEQYAGVVHWLDDLSAEVLSICQGARSLREHLLLVAARCSSVDPVVLRATVADLYARGLLYPVHCPPSRRAGVPRLDEPMVGVVTADRPEALRRCLGHLVRHCQQFGRIPEIVVVDGSRQLRNRLQNRRTVQHWRSHGAGRWTYVGDVEAQNLRRALAADGVERELLDFALVGGAGANRNVLTLLTTGRTLVTFDDDVICRPWTLAGADTRLVLGGHHDHHDYAFYDSRQRATSGLIDSDADVCRAHHRLLGRSLSELVEERVDGAVIRETCPHMLRWLQLTDQAVVRLTFAGLAGDSGAACPYSLLFNAGPALRRCFGDESQFATALSSREVRRAVRSETVTDTPWCMAYCMGLDNRVLVPPFMPIGRNQDGVFGAMMKRLDATSLSVHLPFGIVHDSDRPASYPATIRWAASTRLCDFVLAALRDSQYQGRSREAGLVQLGRVLSEIGSATASWFLSFTMHAALDARCEALALADLTRTQMPGYWSAAIDRCREVLTNSATSQEFFLANDLVTEGSIEMRRDALQGVIARFGRLTSAWPEITTAARTLGVRALAS
jgi:hypothetical protein